MTAIQEKIIVGEYRLMVGRLMEAALQAVTDTAKRRDELARARVNYHLSVMVERARIAANTK
jgi:hypothetical protein